MTSTLASKTPTHILHTTACLGLSFCLFAFLLLPTSLNASARFKAAQNYNLGALYPESVAVADLNNDGKPDLVVASARIANGQSLVTVLLGDGDGTFHLSDTLDSEGEFAMSVKVADMNEDGKLDLVVANCGGPNLYGCGNGTDGRVAIFLGNGNGTFQAPTTYDSGGGQALSVAVADLNLDGRLDVLVGNGCADPACTKTGGVGVLLGNGDGTLQAVVAHSGVGQGSVTVADVNRDGKPDLVLGVGSSGINVLLGNGDGTFEFPAFYRVSGLSPPTTAVADVNGDGKPDVVALVSGGLVSVLLGNGDGIFQPAKTYGSGGELSVSVALADVNGDGRPDVVVTNCGPNCSPTGTGGLVGVLLGNGDGTFKGAATFASGGKGANSVAVADLNGDSRPDLVVTNFWSGDVGVLLNDGPYSTSTILTSSLNPSTYGQKVTWAAMVTTTGTVAPTGNVVFRWSRDGQNYTIGTAPLNAAGVATLTRSNLYADPFGEPYPLVAVYSGDAVNLGSSTSAVLPQHVLQTKTAASIISSVNPSSQGQAVTFTAKITSPTVIVTGPVTFSVGTTVLGTTQLWGGGNAKFTTSTLPLGANRVKVTYYGNSNIAKSSALLTQTVQ
jgi:hypothetical protein